jgi:hypothetical protein
VGVPVVLTGFCAGWEALSKWVPDYLAKSTEGKEGMVYITDRKAIVKGVHQEQKMTIAQLIDEFKKPEFKSGSQQYYLAGDNIQQNFSALMADIQPFAFGSSPDSVLDISTLISLGLWLGYDGQVSSAHFDCAQNLNTVIRGKKVFTMATPESFLNMYPHTWKSCNGDDQDGQIYRFSQIDIFNADKIQFPNLSKVKFTPVTIEKGETLYIPVGWWHHVRSIGDENDGIHSAINLFFDAADDYWTRKELRYINDFKTKYSRAMK